MYVLRWREERREDRARHPVPSPISVMCSTSPPPSKLSPPSPCLEKWVCAGWGCAISHPLHWLTWSGGIYEKEGFPAFLQGPQNVLFHWRIHTDQMAVKRFRFAKEFLAWKFKNKLKITRMCTRNCEKCNFRLQRNDDLLCWLFSCFSFEQWALEDECMCRTGGGATVEIMTQCCRTKVKADWV